MIGSAHAHREAGLSLIEVLVALSIVAVMAVTVVALVRVEGGEERSAADDLLRSFVEARQEAMTSGRVVGFAADPDARGYRFYIFADGVWSPRLDHPAFEPRRFADPDLQLVVVEGAVRRAASNAETSAAPEVWFDPTGFDLPFSYALSGAETTLALVRSGDGALALVERDAAEAG